MNLKRRRTTRDDKADQLIQYLATNYVSGTLVADHDLMSALGWSRSTVGAARHRAVEQGRLRFQGLTGAGGGVGYELVPASGSVPEVEPIEDTVGVGEVA